MYASSSLASRSLARRQMAQQERPRTQSPSIHRLQTRAHLDKRDTPSPSHLDTTETHAHLGREVSDLSSYSVTTTPTFSQTVTKLKGDVNSSPRDDTHRPIMKPVLQLPDIIIRDTPSNDDQSETSIQHSQPIITHFPDILFTQPDTLSETPSSISKSLDLPPRLRSKSQTSQKSLPVPVSTTSPRKTKRRRRFSFEDDPKRLAMKMTMPCSSGCCYCVYASLLGPVKVYITRADRPKKEPFLGGIKDGNGKAVIPVSRKSDVRGLVYDSKSHSLHPPAKGQRPMFQEVPQLRKRRASTQSSTQSKNS